MVEHHPYKVAVDGSIPSGPTKRGMLTPLGWAFVFCAGPDGIEGRERTTRACRPVRSDPVPSRSEGIPSGPTRGGPISLGPFLIKIDASPAPAYAGFFRSFLRSRKSMDKEHEGLCAACAEKPRESAESTAKLCGHSSHLSETVLCVACAVRLGLCRGCGMSLALKQQSP